MLRYFLLTASVFFLSAEEYSGQQVIGAGYPTPNSLRDNSSAQPARRNAEGLRGSGMGFTPNKGQVADINGKLCPEILYNGDGGGANIYLRGNGITYVYSNASELNNKVREQVEDLIKAGVITEAEEKQKKEELMRNRIIQLHRVDMDFEECNNNIRVINEDEQDGYNNYYYSHCPNGVLNVKQYNKVTYKNIYSNIDVTYYGDKQNGIKYDLIVQPHADPNQIKLHWKGAKELRIINENGSTGLSTRLKITTSVNEFYESIPKVYQNINGKIVDVKAQYVLNGTTVNFELGTWNPEYALVIDPWATYYGGSVDEWGGADIDTDALGNVFMVGTTNSGTGIASATGFQTVLGGTSSYMVKFTPTGVRIWATYYGTGTRATSLATDLITGDVYLSGSGGAAGLFFGGFQAAVGPGFLAKFNAAGIRIWSTFFNAIGSNLATDPNTGDVFMTGTTGTATNIVTTTGIVGFQTVVGGTNDAFLVKFNSAGARLWGTYYGGSGTESGDGVAFDATSGSVYLTGYTNSTNGIFSGGFQNAFGGGAYDAFLVKFNGTNCTRIWATYYGGVAWEEDLSVAADGLGNVFLAGKSRGTSTGIASGGYQNTYIGGFSDAFVVKFNPGGNRLWGTYSGTNQQDQLTQGGCIAVDVNNNVYVYFEPEDVITPDFPPCSYQPVNNNGAPFQPGDLPEDQIIIKISPAGQKLCSTYMGGSGHDDLDDGGAIAIFGNALYITGGTGGQYPVTAGAHQTLYAGRSMRYGDAFVACLCTNICEPKVIGLNYTVSSNSVCTNNPLSYESFVANSCDTSGYKFLWTFAGGNPASSSSTKPVVTYPVAGTYTVKLVVTTTCKKDSVEGIIVVNPSCVINATASGATVCPNNCASVSASGSNGTAPYTYSWSTGANTQTINVCPTSTSNYFVTITDASGNTAVAPAQVIVTPLIIVTPASTNITCISTINQPGNASVDVSGSTAPPYNYSWSNGGTFGSITGLTSGNYTVTIRDGNSCTKTQTFNIIDFIPPSATFTTPPACVGQQACFIHTGSTGTSYDWLISTITPANVSGTTTDFCYSFLTAGTYTVKHTVRNGNCYREVSQNISVGICVGPVITTTGSSVCPGSCGTVTSTGAGGASPYTYSWSNGATTQNISPCPTSTTVYTVTIRDTGGNTSTSTAVVAINPAVAVTISPTNISCNGGTNGSATAAGVGGSPVYSYSWNSGATTSQISNLTSQIYTVTITDSKGCSAISTTAIVSPPALAGQFAKGTASCIGCGCKEWIMINASGGIGPYNYTWPDGYLNRYKNHLCPGAYNVYIKDKNGCSINVNLTAP